MRPAPWFVLLPILMLAQSSAPPSQGVPVDHTANGAKDSRSKTGIGIPPSQPITTATEKRFDSTKQTSEISPTKEPPLATPDPIVKYTKWLVIVGILQFIALIIQAVFLCLAFNETTKATGLTAQALAEAVRSNAASEALTTQSNTTTGAAVVEAQRSNARNEELTAESLAETRRATNLTKESLLLTHRPRIIVRAFYLDGEMSAIKEGSLMDGRFEVVNIGETPAEITDIFVMGKMFGFLPMKRPFEDALTSAGRSTDGSIGLPRPLSSGESLKCPFRKGDGALLQGEASEIHAAQKNSRWFCVLGFIKYTDGQNPPTSRTTVFCRQFSRETLGFVPIKNPDYESAD